MIAKRFLSASIATIIFFLVLSVGFKTIDRIPQDVIYYILFFQFVFIHIVSIFIDLFLYKGESINGGVTTFAYLLFGIIGNIIVVHVIASDLVQSKEEFIIMGLLGAVHAVFYYMIYSMLKREKIKIKQKRR